MKKTAVTVAFMLFASFTFAQKMADTKIPAIVKSAFTQKYPTVKAVKWDKEGTNYEASFTLNKADNSVLIDPQGKILETEVEIELSGLPNGITDYVKSHYKGKPVKEAAKITDSNGTVTYEVEIKGMDLMFDSNGNFIKEIKGE
jgi:hypothetical protein